MTDFIFIIPDPSEFISGGNSYNRKLIHAIAQAGGSVQHMTYEQFKDIPSTPARHVFERFILRTFG